MDEWERYDALDVESVVYHGADEAEDLDPEVAGIMRGYLEAGEL
jgi:hypothetical protein